MTYLCKEKYRLEVHWDQVNYQNNSIAVLQGAYFSGPVLKNAAKIEAPDYIDLDFTPQCFILMDSYYIVRLSWDEVEYRSDNTILLKGATLTNDYLKSIHKLEDGDFILVNTENHEEEMHPYSLTYEAQVMRKDREPHNYRGR